MAICYLLFTSGCGEGERINTNKEKNNAATETKNDETIISEPTTVHWMYMDDSLRSGCKPLNYILPWMESDIMEIPENITPEIFSIPVIKNFQVIEKGKERMNDSIFLFTYKLKKNDCICDIFRMYKRNPNQEKTSGHFITEQIICNTKINPGQNKINNNQKETKYEVHGHEH